MNPAYIQISSKNNEIYRKDRVSDNHGGVFQAVKKYIIVTSTRTARLFGPNAKSKTRDQSLYSSPPSIDQSRMI